MREPSEFEKKDHIHHRSFWFDHGDVNGISFWDETSRHGTIEHREYVEMRRGGDGRDPHSQRLDRAGRDRRSVKMSAP